jgi:hypothetical protein
LGSSDEAAIAHAIGDKVEAAYRRSDRFDRRCRLMDTWAGRSDDTRWDDCCGYLEGPSGTRFRGMGHPAPGEALAVFVGGHLTVAFNAFESHTCRSSLAQAETDVGVELRST